MSFDGAEGDEVELVVGLFCTGLVFAAGSDDGALLTLVNNTGCLVCGTTVIEGPVGTSLRLLGAGDICGVFIGWLVVVLCDDGAEDLATGDAGVLAGLVGGAAGGAVSVFCGIGKLCGFGGRRVRRFRCGGLGFLLIVGDPVGLSVCTFFVSVGA